MDIKKINTSIVIFSLRHTETYIEYYEKLYIHYIYAYECVYRIIRRYVHLI